MITIVELNKLTVIQAITVCSFKLKKKRRELINLMHAVDEFFYSQLYGIWKFIRLVDVRSQKEKFHFVVQHNPEVGEI